MNKVGWMVMLVACSGDGTSQPSGTVSCGAGTVLDGTTCLAATLCGAGTHEENGVCVLDAGPTRYDLRTASTIRANGYSTVNLTLVDTNGDGTPSHERVVFTTDRASAGSLVSPAIVLGDRGGATSFLPCNSTDAGCVGPVRFTAALASAPAVPIAHVDAVLVAPPPVASITPCMVGGNVLHFESTSFGTLPTRTITTDGVFDVFGAAWRARVQVYAAPDAYTLELNTKQLDIPLLPTVYDDAQRIGVAAAYQPVFDTGHHPCGVISTFQIHSFTYDEALDDVTQITASFAAHCEFFPPDTQPTKTLTGCVHYSQ